MGPKRSLDVNGDEQEKKRERGGYTAEFKVKLIDIVKSGKYSTNAAALAAFNKQQDTQVKKPSMSEWLKNEIKLRTQAADPATASKLHAKGSDFPYIDDAMKWWYFQVSRQKGAQLTDAMLQNQATQYRDLIMALSAADDLPAVVEHYSKFNASTGWVTKFKSRVIARSVKAKGEAGSADMDGVAVARAALPRLLQKWEPRNVWNMDETGLFYRALPSRTITSEANKSGLKLRKDRIMLGLLCSMYGKSLMRRRLLESCSSALTHHILAQERLQWDAEAAAEDDTAVDVISVTQAQQYAEAVMNFVSAHPDQFSAGLVSSASRLADRLSRVVISNCTADGNIRQFMVPAAAADPAASAAAAAAAPPPPPAAAADPSVAAAAAQE